MSTPPARAMSHSKALRALQALSMDSSEVEHPVVALTLGPVRSSWYETRVAM